MPRVDEVIAQLHAARADLLAELEQIERALIAFSPDTDRQIGPTPAGAQAAIIAALRLRGGEPADIAELLEGARSLGWRSTSRRPRGVIASTVSKMTRSGSLQRVGEGRYRLAEVHTDLELEIA